MSQNPTLLFLHGIGTGDPAKLWYQTLDRTLKKIGYPGLSGLDVIAPHYPNGLSGIEDPAPLPEITVIATSGDAAKSHRRDYWRRRTAMEVLLGPDDRGEGWPGGDQLAPVVAGQKKFVQAENYVNNPPVRAWVLTQVLRKLGDTRRVVIVGHSLGSVIAADLVRRLPTDVEVVGIITIGSPLAHDVFHVDNLRSVLAQPPVNLGWWVNFWNTADLVPARRGLSGVWPWVLDQRIKESALVKPIKAHSAETYLGNRSVALAIGRAVFGSQTDETGHTGDADDVALDYGETNALVALRYAHLVFRELEGDQRERYADALRQAQADTVARVRQRNASEERPVPPAIERLAVGLDDPAAPTPEPEPVRHLPIEDAIVPLLAIADTNVIWPFEIKVDEDERQRAMEQLTLDMQLGRQVGANVFRAQETAQKALKGSTSWMKWTAFGLGSAALVAATGGLALAAAPGVAGAAAVTSALAAFGPGGMIGGLLTAGTLVSAGTGTIAAGLTAADSTAEAAEAVVVAQLAAAVMRELQGLEQDPELWNELQEAKVDLLRTLTRLEAISDESAPSLKQLKRKLETIDNAVKFLKQRKLAH